MGNGVLPLMLIAPLLLAVGYFDLRYMRIPNLLSLIAVGAFAVVALAMPPDDLVARISVAAVVFAAGFAAFCLRLVGGGDVKILAGLMLFVPVTSLTAFAYVFSAALLAGIALILALRRIPAVRRSPWKSLGGSQKFPMGISIALAGIVHPVVVTILAAQG